jgi:putative molybdopterin biosynthesis protein
MWSDVSMSSSHVGSMGGIMSVRRGEAHVAGTHLLDEATGGYNTSFIKKYFPRGGVRLVECVNRSQGMMVAKGNPKNFNSMADLTSPGMRYVNRQKGSGTRVLFDYLCKKDGVDTGAIYGYEREEYTHTSVAALIQAGSADAGLGIYSAAKLYGLDFLPICDEQYDLLVPDYAWGTRLLDCLIEVLKSDAFRTRLTALGGYTLKNPGTVRERF